MKKESENFWDYIWDKLIISYGKFLLRKRIACDSSELKFYAYDFDD